MKSILKNTLRNLLCFLLASLTTFTWAVKVEESKPEEAQVTEINGTTVITINDMAYSIAQVPAIANQFENITDLSSNTELKNKLPLGELVLRSEIDTLIEAYYKKYAVDSSSIIIRNLSVANAQSWALWCINPWLFGCLERRGSGGTWVEFEINGKNRSGGMSGFTRTIWMVRRFSRPNL